MLLCDECPAFYRGHTRRSLGVRIEEHKISIFHNELIIGLYNLCITLNHFKYFNITKISRRVEKGERLDLS